MYSVRENNVNVVIESTPVQVWSYQRLWEGENYWEALALALRTSKKSTPPKRVWDLTDTKPKNWHQIL